MVRAEQLIQEYLINQSVRRRGHRDDADGAFLLVGSDGYETAPLRLLRSNERGPMGLSPARAIRSARGSSLFFRGSHRRPAQKPDARAAPGNGLPIEDTSRRNPLRAEEEIRP